MARRPNVKKAQFIAELMANGGNQSKAAEAVGWNPQHGRRLASKDPEVQAAIVQAKETAQNVLRDWNDLAVKAQNKLEALIDAKDERVAFLAVKETLDRHLGKSTAKVEHSGEVNTKVIEDEGVMMAILTLMGRKNWTLAQAYNYVKGNPREVQEWMQSLPAAGQTSGEPIPEADYTIEESDDAGS